jgi:tetratricopeptide (TPR) repeat protein
MAAGKIGTRVAENTPGSAFVAQLEDLVAEATRDRRKLKKQLASDFRMRPDRLSHLLAGRRRPTEQEVLDISRGLRLDEPRTRRLREAAGFRSPAGGPEVGPVVDVLDRLGSIEQAVARDEMELDLALVRQAWGHYVDSQARNQARDWGDASQRHREGLELYWRLRATAARFLGQVHLAASAADPHVNRVAEAEARCEEGLQAATMARSRPFEVMLMARLASIRRLRSDYEAAGKLYERALEALDGWAAEDDRDASRPANEAWRDHWRARIQRMQGVLELFQGHPARALRKLETSRVHFERDGHLEELAQVCYGLGWAHGLRGDLEEAASWDRRGLEYTELGNRNRGREDERSLLQGHLYLGGDYLDLDDLANARDHLENARDLAQRPHLSQYHEVGRVHLLLGKLEMGEGSFERAQPHLQTALDFFGGREERTLLATAHNTMGDFHLLQGGLHLQRAIDHYARALAAARACRPSNAYYECAALVNLCRARIGAGLPAAELSSQRDGPSGSEREWDVDTVITHARELSRMHRYLNHRSRLAVLEAEWARRRGDDVAARDAARTALHAAHNFSVHLLSKVSSELSMLGLPHRLSDVPPADLD